MSDPYRDGSLRDPLEAPRDQGIVGDVISQFADPNAFYRELIQNSIDAGSPEIGVEISYDDAAQRVRVAVRDRGEGMTREIIENQLLVLFRSTKEKDRTKIGKFGIGFASVLAPNPEVVIVNTSRDGKRLTLHLYRDLSYELFDGGRATQAGTTVELEIAVPRDQLAGFKQQSEAALRRWCRHATVPIELTTHASDARIKTRIDTPLEIDDALIQVKREFDDGELTVVAGIQARPTPYIGFFNHGLMLHESTTNGLIGNVAVKILDSRLGHTLSRDDVRRDSHYKHAVEIARKVVFDELTAAASAKLQELAAEGGGGPYCDLVEALVDTLDPRVWHFPLVEPFGGKLSIAHGALGRRGWVSSQPTKLTKALAAAGVPVLRVTRRYSLEKALRAAGSMIADVEYELTSISYPPESEFDAKLLAEIYRLLDHAHRAPDAVILVQLEGAHADLMAIALSSRDTRMVDREDGLKSPFPLFGRRVLGLSVAHPHVKAARESDNVHVAAAHLARAVLLGYTSLDPKRSRRLLDTTLDAIGVDE